MWTTLESKFTSQSRSHIMNLWFGLYKSQQLKSYLAYHGPDKLLDNDTGFDIFHLGSSFYSSPTHSLHYKMLFVLFPSQNLRSMFKIVALMLTSLLNSILSFVLLRIVNLRKFFFVTNLTKASTDLIIHPYLHNHLS